MGGKPKVDDKVRGEKQQEIEKLKVEIEKKGKTTEKTERKLFFLGKKYDKIKNLGKFYDFPLKLPLTWRFWKKG